jgi:hypothetical protein
MSVMADRRECPRYPLVVMAEVTVLSSGVKLTARTSDVSRTGCYVDTRAPSSKGTHVQLRLVHRGEAFETHARVVYSSPGLGMGIRFKEFVTEAQLATMDRWLGDASKNLEPLR